MRPPRVRLEVERLDHVAGGPGAYTLRATGRAWADTDLRLGVPLLLAGNVRVEPVPSTPPVLASPAGAHWVADYEVSEGVATAAEAWAVETELPAPPVVGAAETGVPLAETALLAAERLRQALAELRELDLAARRIAQRPDPAAELPDTAERAEEPAEQLARIGRRRDAAAAEARRLRGVLDAEPTTRGVAAPPDPPSLLATAPSGARRRGHAPVARPSARVPPNARASAAAPAPAPERLLARRRRCRIGVAAGVTLAAAGTLLVADAVALVV